MGITTDRDDPGLQDVDPETKMQAKYLVLSDEERARGFVNPVYDTYIHTKCGAKTKMGKALSETYARKPDFYGATYCVVCRDHYPVGADGEFYWVDKYNNRIAHKVGAWDAGDGVGTDAETTSDGSDDEEREGTVGSSGT
jgi:hypothetical protein